MSQTNPVILWFRQDLRLSDNPAFNAALEMDAPLLPLYVLDDVSPGEHRMGGASRWWLHESLYALNRDLDQSLLCLTGDASTVVPNVARNTGAAAVFWNRCYEPWRISRDKRIKTTLSQDGRKVRSFNGSLLFEPPNVSKDDGTPYRVFTPFWNKGCLENSESPRRPQGRIRHFKPFRDHGGESVDDLGLLPDINWYGGMAEAFSPGEDGARRQLDRFINRGLPDYAEGRDRPDQPLVSRLSPHLHFGEISPHTVWHAVRELSGDESLQESVDRFCSELGWREFSYYLLYYCTSLPEQNLQRKFDRFPWRDDPEALERWQKGQTGIPLVDAGMRELWQTGYMHNRVRMIVASFLIKNLMIDWRKGAAWFWDTLVDADLANNSASWQWVAGSGADAAPYFRIFNPVTQGRRFDPMGDYVRRYVPELAKLSDKAIHAPWEASPAELEDAGVELGSDYPEPMVDLQASRKRALDAFKALS